MNETRKSPAKSARRRSRELAIQGIYQWRLTGVDLAQVEKQMREEKNLGNYDAKFFGELLRGVLMQHTDIEAAIAPHLDRPLGELSPVELAVLLLAAYELLQHPEIPYRVIINEAVELAKTFGGTDGFKYVNGVLDKLAGSLRQVEARRAAR